MFDLNCCSSELHRLIHRQPGERDNPVPAKARPGLQSRTIAVGGRDHSTALERERELYNSDSPCAFRSPQGGVLCTHCARRINQDAHHRLKISRLVISRHVIRMVPHIFLHVHVLPIYLNGIGSPRTPWISPHLPHDFHRFRFPTAPYRHALYAWVPPSPRVSCALPKGVCYLLTVLIQNVRPGGASGSSADSLITR